FQQVGVSVTGAFEATKVLTYAAIIVLMRRYKKIQPHLGSFQSKFSKSVYRMTAAAAVNSLGGWSIFIFFAIWYIYQWTTGTRIVSFTYYALILRLTTSFNNVLTPYVMLISFKSLRQIFFGRRASTEVTTMKGDSSVARAKSTVKP
ncbi:hypothetical protein PMAYCL1PPCAC_05880, partial [Pristionchus mayeri]